MRSTSSKFKFSAVLWCFVLECIAAAPSFSFGSSSVKVFEAFTEFHVQDRRRRSDSSWRRRAQNMLYPYVDLTFSTSTQHVNDIQCKATLNGTPYVSYAQSTTAAPMYASNLDNITCTEPVEFYVATYEDRTTQCTKMSGTAPGGYSDKGPPWAWYYPKGTHTLPEDFFKLLDGYGTKWATHYERKTIRVPQGCKLRLTTTTGESLELKTPPSSCPRTAAAVYTSTALTVLMDQQGGMLTRFGSKDFLGVKSDIVSITISDAGERSVTIAPRPITTAEKDGTTSMWGRTYAVTCRMQDKNGQWSSEERNIPWLPIPPYPTL